MKALIFLLLVVLPFSLQTPCSQMECGKDFICCEEEKDQGHCCYEKRGCSKYCNYANFLDDSDRIPAPISSKAHDCDREDFCDSKEMKCCRDGPQDGYCCAKNRACNGGKCLYFNYLNLIEMTPTPADYAVLLESFFETIGLFEYIPKSCECIKDIIPVVPEIIEMAKNLTQIQSVEDLMVIVFYAYKHVYPELKKIFVDCKDLPVELKVKIAEIIAIVKEPGFFAKVMANAKAHLPEIIMNAKAGYMMIEDHNFKQAGKNFGEIFNVLF